MASWNEILTPEQIDEQFALTAAIDPGFALKSRAFWEMQNAADLRSLRAGAWTANDRDAYQMAGSYLANNFGQ